MKRGIEAMIRDQYPPFGIFPVHEAKNIVLTMPDKIANDIATYCFLYQNTILIKAPVILIAPATARPYAAASFADSPNTNSITITQANKNQLTEFTYICALNSFEVYSTLKCGNILVVIA